MKLYRHYSILLLVLFALCLSSCSDPNAPRILFLGNSYTHYNNLPELFSRLAKSGGHNVHAEKYAPGGWLLADHAAAEKVLTLIEEGNWDTVILQEQSVLPATIQRDAEMYPAARILHQHISANEAQTMFFLTWGRQEGTAVREIGFNHFSDMQTQLNDGYGKIAAELNVPLAPVGVAWQNALNERPDMPLYVEDGSHPTKHGSYLAAAVFYAAFFGESPEGLEYTAGLSAEDAQFLQRIASETVLAAPERWRLPLPNQ